MWLTDGKVRPWGNAKDQIRQSYGSGWRIVENEPSTIPETGWIAVYTTGPYLQWGHIGTVYNGGNTNRFLILEQNWNGYANKKPTTRWDNYYGLTHFIVPPVAKEEEKKQNKTISKPAEKKDKKSVPVLTKNITGYSMDKRGYNPRGITIHNDGSVGNYKTYYNSLVNASYDRLARGIAHAYVDRNGIWEAIDESRIAWHCADGVQKGSGNHDFYGIEVNESMSASDKDFLQNEQMVFWYAAQKLKKWGLPANRNTIRLHNEFSRTACPHRSMKLHSGLDPLHNSITEEARLKTKDYFIKQIRAYMDGKEPPATTVKNKPGSASTPATRPNINGWKMNQYGTYYKPENATFKANTAIYARYVGPFTTCPQSGVLQAGQSVTYDTVCKQDGYVWISYTANNGKDIWLPVRTWDKTTDSVGPLWGTIY